MKKVSVLALVLVMLLTCMVTGMAEDKIPLTWLGYYTSNYTIPDNTWAEQLIEEKFPNVDIIPVTTVNRESSSVYINTGEVLDATLLNYWFMDAMNIEDLLLNQELLRTIPMEWLQEYYPDGMKAATDIIGENAIAKSGFEYNGESVIVPLVSAQSYAPFVVLYRQDWLNNLGMKVPTTFEEFHDMLYAFTFNDPDQNGVNDTYGWDPAVAWVGPDVVYGNFGFMNALNKGGTFMKKEDGAVSYSSVSEEYRKALAVVRDWYAEGILDPECLTDGRNQIRSKWTAGNTGVITDVYSWIMTTRGVQGLIGMVEAVHGENTVAIMPPLTTTEGDGNVYSAYTNSPFITGGWCFTASATDDQVKAALTIMNECAKNDVFYFSLLYGEKGVDWDYDENGILKITPEAGVLEYQVSKGVNTFFYGTLNTLDRLAQTMPAADIKTLNIANEWKLTYSERNFGSVENNAYNTYFAEVRKVESEYWANVVAGKANLEGDWDQYVANMSAAGLSKIITEYETILK